MKILFAGENVGGSANYYLGVFNRMKARVTHAPSSKTLRASAVSSSIDAIILSDFSKKDLPPEAEKRIAERVNRGAGLMMVGGWGSFSGPFGKWRGSVIEKLLPVLCSKNDDRINYPQGAYPVFNQPHSIIKGLSFLRPPMICGLNRLAPKKQSISVLLAQPLRANAASKLVLRLERKVPFLVVHSDQRLKTAALATDLAPHWCGGLVDWGKKRLKLRVNDGVQVEVGENYALFLSGMVRWLAGVI